MNLDSTLRAMVNLMRKKDFETRTTIENMLKNSSSGQNLKNYFNALPDKSIRRAISVLSDIYPDKTTVLDEDFSFILYMFSDIKFIGQESFPYFVQAINILDFTERQKKLLIATIKNNIEILCNRCTFELGSLLESLFEPHELLQYLEVLTEKESRPVLIQVFNILLYKDSSKSYSLDEKIEALKEKVSKLINS